MPEITAPLKLRSLLMSPGKETQPGMESVHLMFAECSGTSLEGAMKSFARKPTELVALVGPEGGWTDEELELARAGGWQIVTLGGRTLRAETAAIVAATLLQHRCGDLV